MTAPADLPEPVRLFYELFDIHRVAAGDFDELYRPHVHDDFELRLPVAYPDIDSLHGFDAVKEMFRMFEQVWEEWRHEPESWATAGDTTVVLSSLIARGRESGLEVATPVAHVWHLRDGRAACVEVQTDRDGALAEAGLESGDLNAWA